MRSPRTDRALICTTSVGAGMVLGVVAERQGQGAVFFLVDALLAATGIHFLTQYWKQHRPWF